MDLCTKFSPEHDDFRGISLCAGYGGLDLGLHIAEPRYRTVAFVERESHAAATLVARMADKALAEALVWDDLRSFDGKPWRGRVHLVAAGYPCQPFTYAGRRRGEADPRHLWPEVARVVGEVQPEWVFCENVEGHLDLGFATVIGDLRKLGYTTKAGVFTAREAGASHRRRRIFLLAHADRVRQRASTGSGTVVSGYPLCAPAGALGDVAGAAERRIRGKDVDDIATCSDGAWVVPGDALPLFAPGPSELQEWEALLLRHPGAQPAVPRDADGLADRLDRTRGVGNGVCSMAAALAWAVLKTAHREGR